MFLSPWAFQVILQNKILGSALCLHCVCAQSCPTLCNPMDCSPPGSSVPGISQAGILEWVAISFSRGSSQLRDQTHVSCISCTGRWILSTEPPARVINCISALSQVLSPFLFQGKRQVEVNLLHGHFAVSFLTVVGQRSRYVTLAPAA